ncbi:hypothetical protein OG897_35335 [Streptomyces sp. NBC_00237]|uniref:hypothetical protein n=1 Tax=Streptomyces sp. NBC_00237 TaxID=2975687 RepID=UPI0022538CCE|nr:hypothetical protein [Streptomyces sp. NBC_00237]MCX5206667.1 hypothetical protein [Streptomyces sp. NBC_00237]
MHPHSSLHDRTNALRSDAERLDDVAARLDELAATTASEGTENGGLHARLRTQAARSRQAAADLREAARRLADLSSRRPGRAAPLVAVALVAVLVPVVLNHRRRVPSRPWGERTT